MILASLKTARLSDADGWGVAERFNGAFSKGAAKKVVDDLKKEWRTEGKSWADWMAFLKNFDEWQTAMHYRLTESLQKWWKTLDESYLGAGRLSQNDRIVTIEGAQRMSDLCMGLVLHGKSAFDKAVRDPSTLPTSPPGHNFKWLTTGDYPGLVDRYTKRATNPLSPNGCWTD